MSLRPCALAPARTGESQPTSQQVTGRILEPCSLGDEGLEPRCGQASVSGMTLRSEVEVLSWGPDRGNPTSMRQGRGPEWTGRLGVAVVWRRRASVRRVGRKP